MILIRIVVPYRGNQQIEGAGYRLQQGADLQMTRKNHCPESIRLKALREKKGGNYRDERAGAV